jgi:hypothetical protein
MLLLHPRTTILKYITGNISFFAELDFMESPRLPGLGPDSTYTSVYITPAHI